jgi:hypothetical protein
VHDHLSKRLGRDAIFFDPAPNRYDMIKDDVAVNVKEHFIYFMFYGNNVYRIPIPRGNHCLLRITETNWRFWATDYEDANEDEEEEEDDDEESGDEEDPEDTTDDDKAKAQSILFGDGEVFTLLVSFRVSNLKNIFF